MRTPAILFLGSLFAVFAACRQEVPAPQPLYPIPNEWQLAWHEMEQYAFIHFTTNTFTGKEWGSGDESPAIFNPINTDVRQWARVIKESGLKGLILTCKHHDGFCLWPSEYTEHSIKNSPYRNGKGDLVKEVADACKEYGLKFGVYLSPWDRNHSEYGKQEYLDYYRNQLRELIQDYGPVFEIWFDGANGGDGYYGGTREIRKIDNRIYYDWPVTIAMVREMAPDAVMFSDGGPDIRWCGNEKGYIGETNWCTLSVDTLYAGKAGINQLLNQGSETGHSWVPAEVDVSIRPGWFYHENEDDEVRTAENLFGIYLQSVGRGANLLLNIPPTKEGLIHEKDVAVLLKWKNLLDGTFADNLALSAKVSATSWRGKSEQYAPNMVSDNDKNTYWATDDMINSGCLEFHWDIPQKIRYVLIQEYIKLGQRIQEVEVDVWDGKEWVPSAKATTIGYKRILPILEVETTGLRIHIKRAKACPVISNIEIY